MNYAFSADDTQVEISAPYLGFMKSLNGTPVIGIGSMVYHFPFSPFLVFSFSSSPLLSFLFFFSLPL